MKSAKEYLEQSAKSWELADCPGPWLHKTFLLRNGTEMKPGRRIGPRGEPNNCYCNSTHSVIDNGGIYVEGIIISNKLPIELAHAWVTFDGETVMDPTLNARGRFYFGVQFSEAELRYWILKNEVYGLIDHGYGYNLDLIFERDPDLKKIMVDKFPETKSWINSYSKQEKKHELLMTGLDDDEQDTEKMEFSV